jgi:uncharacterized membrane protein
MNKRMLMALVALIGVFVSLYLTLYKLGYIGTLACGTGSCETVQLTRWGDLLGLPVAAWGAGYYALVLVLTMAGLQERFAQSRSLALATLLLTAWGVIFTTWLTYLELFVIHAVCRWCLGSAAMVIALFGLAVSEWRTTGDQVVGTSEEARGVARGA